MLFNSKLNKSAKRLGGFTSFDFHEKLMIKNKVQIFHIRM